MINMSKSNNNNNNNNNNNKEINNNSNKIKIKIKHLNKIIKLKQISHVLRKSGKVIEIIK